MCCILVPGEVSRADYVVLFALVLPRGCIVAGKGVCSLNDWLAAAGPGGAVDNLRVLPGLHFQTQ